MHIDHLYTTNIPLVKRKAAEGDAQFQLILGMMYYRGESVFHDKEKAKHWIRKSAENGNEVASKLAECLNYERTFNKVLLEHLSELPFMIESQSEFEKHVFDVQNPPPPEPPVIGTYQKEGGIAHDVYHIWVRTVNPKKTTKAQVLIFQIGTVLFAVLLVSAMFFKPNIYDYEDKEQTKPVLQHILKSDSINKEDSLRV